MAQITITGNIEDSQNVRPSSGTVNFKLSDWYLDSNGDITLPKTETCSINPSDGTFSIILESTEDGTPSTRAYAVSVACTISGVAIQQDLGSFTLPPSPTTRLLKDLLLAGIGSIPSGAVLFIDREVPTGTIDGTNLAFATLQTPIAGSENVFLNGILQTLTVDYHISGATITFVVPPIIGDKLVVSYRRSP